MAASTAVCVDASRNSNLRVDVSEERAYPAARPPSEIPVTAGVYRKPRGHEGAQTLIPRHRCRSAVLPDEKVQR